MNGLAWRASVPFMGTVGSNPTPSGDLWCLIMAGLNKGKDKELKIDYRSVLKQK